MAYVLDKDLQRVIVVPRVTLHTTNPGVSDDTAHGYTPGDLWINTSAGTAYTQASGAAGAAVWLSAPGNAITGATIDNSVIGGVTPAAGAFTYVHGSIAVGLAAIGTNRGNSLALAAQTNIVATAASTAVGVTLPLVSAVGVGGIVRVANDGPANSFHVYGAGSDTIDGQAAATGVVLTNAFYADYQATAAATYVSFRSAITRSA